MPKFGQIHPHNSRPSSGSFLQDINRRIETILELFEVHRSESVIFEELLGPLLSPSGAESQSIRTAVQRNRHTMEHGNGVDLSGGRVTDVLFDATIDADIEKEGSPV